jgi:uncharacterized membrane protein
MDQRRENRQGNNVSASGEATPEHVHQHVETIARHEQDFLARRTPAERLGDTIGGFVGTLWFVTIHLGFIGVWIYGNSTNGKLFTPFDPPPFSTLEIVLATEAVLLASFILMRQNRMNRRADERDHLMLQVLLLAEKEITKLLEIEMRKSEHSGVLNLAKDEELTKLSQPTSVDELTQTISDNLPKES